MKQTPVFITEYGLARLLKEFAQRLGIEENMADAMAQVHMQQTTSHRGWTKFIHRNCFRCVKAPNTCDFLNPQEHNCVEGATPESVRSAYAMVIELDKLDDCPSRRDPEDSRIRKRQPQPSAAEGEENDAT